MSPIKSRLLVVTLSITMLSTFTNFRFTSAQQDEKTVKVAAAAGVSTQNVSLNYGMANFAGNFGLVEKQDNFVAMDSGPIAIQAILSGQADVLSSSFLLLYSLREQRQSFKMFCPLIGGSEQILVGRNGVTTMAQVFDPKTRVGLDGPGGGAYAVLNALLLQQGSKLTSTDLKNIKVLESSSTRFSAFAAGDVDATFVRLSQYGDIKKSVPDAVVIARAYTDLPQFIFNPLSASSDWLDQHRDIAAAFCATVLKGSIELLKSPDIYINGVKAFVTKPPSDDVLKDTYNFILQYGIWDPAKTMNPKTVDFMSQLAVRTGLTKDMPKAEDLLDMQTYQAAVALLSKEDQAALAAMPSAELAATAAASAAPTQAN